jgi:hypothetical protein
LTPGPEAVEDPGVSPGTYYRSVFARAWRDTVAFLKAHVLVGLAITVFTAVVTGMVSANFGETFNPRVAIYAAVWASAVIAVIVLVWNMVTVPWRMHQELLARLQAFERRRDVGRLIQLRERGLQLLDRRVPIVERAHHDMSDQELSAYLAADNQELLVYQMTRHLWEEETAAELEKCATESEVSLFRVIDNEVSSFKELGLITARDFPGVTVVLDHEKAMLTERLNRLLAIIRRIEDTPQPQDGWSWESEGLS